MFSECSAVYADRSLPHRPESDWSSLITTVDAISIPIFLPAWIILEMHALPKGRYWMVGPIRPHFVLRREFLCCYSDFETANSCRSEM